MFKWNCLFDGKLFPIFLRMEMMKRVYVIIRKNRRKTNEVFLMIPLFEWNFLFGGKLFVIFFEMEMIKRVYVVIRKNHRKTKELLLNLTCIWIKLFIRWKIIFNCFENRNDDIRISSYSIENVGKLTKFFLILFLLE